MSQTKAQLLDGKSATIQYTAGSASAPAISFTGDTNTGIYSPGADQVAISTGGSGRLFVDASGRVGVGTNSPSYALDVISNSTYQLRLASSTSNYASGGLYLGAAGTGDPYYYGYVQWNQGSTTLDIAAQDGTGSGGLRFLTNGGSTSPTERARIDVSGRLLVGTSSARGVASSTNSLVQIETSSYSALSVVNNTNDGGGSAIALAKSRGTSAGGSTIVQAGDDLGTFFFAGADGTNTQSQAAFIKCTVEGTPAAGKIASRLVFSTTADGASSPTERLRIDSSGRVGIGTSPEAPLHVKATGGSTNSVNTGLIVNYESTGPTTSGGGTGIRFRGSSGGGGTANYDQAQIATNTTGSNNDHGLDFYTRRSAASGLIKRFSIDEYGGIRNYVVPGGGPVAVFGYESGEAARITNAGQLLVGTSSSFAGNSIFQVASTNNVVAQLYRSGAQESAIDLGSTTGTLGSPSALVQSAGMGAIYFSGYDGAAWQYGALIVAQADGQTWASGDCPTRLVFSTTADGASSPTERMRITSGGELLVGGTNDNGAYNIQCNGTGVWGFGAYVNGSDERLKENINPLPASLDVVKALNPVVFQYKPEFTADTSVQPGFIAQELQTALAGQVYVDGVVRAGGQYLNVAYQALIPVLTKALQEAIGEIELLKTRIADLERA